MIELLTAVIDNRDLANGAGAAALLFCFFLWRFSLKIGGGFTSEETGVLDKPYNLSNRIILFGFVLLSSWLIFRLVDSNG